MNFKYVFLISALLLTACKEDPKPATEEWAETKGVISNVESIDGRYAYMITYDAPESTAVDQAGKEIKGPIEQSGLFEKKPVNKQEIKLRYRRDEPVMFELQEEIKFE